MSRQPSSLWIAAFAVAGITALLALPGALSPLIEAQPDDLVPPGVWSGEMSGFEAINESTFGPSGQWRIYRPFDRPKARLLIRTGQGGSGGIMFGVIFLYSDFDTIGDEELAQHFAAGFCGGGGDENLCVGPTNEWELPGYPWELYKELGISVPQTFCLRLKTGQWDFSRPFRFGISSCPDPSKNEAEYDACMERAKTEYQPHLNPLDPSTFYAAKSTAGAHYLGNIQGRFERDTATGTWEATSDWGNSVSGTWKAVRLGTSVGTDSLPWEVVPTGLGVLAAGGVLIAAITNILAINRKRRAQSGKPDQNPDEVVGYVLQLSADTVTVSSQQPAPLSAAVWQVTAAGTTQIAADASIEVEVPAWAADFLRPQPARGSGRVEITISVTRPPASQEVTMTVRASGSKGGASAPVKIMVQLDYDIDFL